MIRSVRVTTGSRLHLGLLGLPGGLWPDADGIENLPARSFGGVGLMIDSPSLTVRVSMASRWPETDDRAAVFARRAAAAFAEDAPPLEVQVEHAPAEHVGLGSGTQLGLAIARAVAELLGRADPSPEVLAQAVGRGLRSGLGAHGFALGGFLVDGGKGSGSTIAPLVCRHPFPDDWRVLVAIPRNQRGLSGGLEREAFARLVADPSSRAQTEALCRLVVLGMIPALVERDLPAFGEAVHDFNRRAGLLFKACQGGVYSSPIVAEIVGMLRAEGIAGVGQSSWGPAVFAFGLPDQLAIAAEKLMKHFPQNDIEVRVSPARNRGHELS